MSLKQKIHSFAAWADTTLLNALTAPFVRTPGLMLLILFLQMVPYYISVFINPRLIPEGPLKALCLLIANTLPITWLVLLVYNLLRRVCKVCAAIWLTLALIAFASDYLLDLVPFLISNRLFNEDIPAVIVASNIEECYNYLAAYSDTRLALTLIISVVAAIAIYLAGSILIGKYLRRWLHDRGPRVCKFIRYGFPVMLIGFFVLYIKYPCTYMAYSSFESKVRLFFRVDTGLPIIPQNPELNINTDDSPLNIVVIFGESHSTSHSELYGYNVHNQPHLMAMEQDSCLFVFKSAVASAQHTISCFQHMIGTYNDQPDKNWNECLTFLEVAQKAGYTTIWLSNQAEKGFYDTPTTKIAYFCDDVEFTNTLEEKQTGFDADLLPIIDKHLKKDRRTLTLIHLMGNHIDYQFRTPEGYKIFTPKEYDLPTDLQRRIIADYDNSIYYNDMVVSTIIKKYEDADAVVIYLSDHGQDVFQSSPTYYGHAITGNQVSIQAALPVPFYVYLSPVFKQKHPTLANRIESSTDNSPHLTDLIYTLMDLMGCSFPDNDDVAQKTFFRPQPTK
ncbi:MAG: phosphoethanolamine transferase [Muribaculaceae bacterium]|nr:phosphoethanolamine transferase [Muribaculaceae bacterium]